ncbi:DUF6179 domain-containing protein [Oceanobacillus neutriphilus]|uniref:Uncharacterized protein n=1 Tax=Oceanobacillus neutriphilus TaxID=531815 RepID=A0ABQ2P1M5_9BACI|nr:DUF6179 domain-containing protein [Oceanobacillus neutriphilus]GGP15921.1 hypothetical protein GCM10011346_45670 [Oceanobacillus neutriphilus]
MEFDNNSGHSRQISNIRIDRSRLKRNQYTLSLLQEGQRSGVISSQKVYQIQVEMVQVLQRLILRYTQEASTSVTTETAEGIMTSLLYAIDTYTLQYKNPDEALTHLNKESIKDIHSKGVELLRCYFEETKQLYQEVKNIKLDVPVDAYHMTIDESLPVFIKHYDIIFEAQNTMASIDYPLAVDDMRLQGVFYIRQYLERLRIETEFCRFFSLQDVMFVLINFGKISRFNYQIELFNMFELMINNAVFSLLSGGKPDNVRISGIQFEQLNRMLTAAPADQRTKLIHQALDQLQKTLQTNQALIDYIDLYRGEFVQRVNNAAKIGSFETLIIREIKEHEKTMVFKLDENDRKSDIQMRSLVDRILEISNSEEKALFIRRHFVSLHDYLDLLHAGCLFNGDYEALFRTFGDIELAILAKIIFYEKLRDATHDLSDIIEDGIEAENEWEIHYIEFMQQLEDERIKAIGNLIYEINYEDISFH